MNYVCTGNSQVIHYPNIQNSYAAVKNFKENLVLQTQCFSTHVAALLATTSNSSQLFHLQVELQFVVIHERLEKGENWVPKCVYHNLI